MPSKPPKPPSAIRPRGWTAADEARWREVLATVLALEGGHSNDPVDRGGETNHGISLRFLKATGALDTDRDGFADLDLNFDTVLDGHDIRAITPEIAGEIYLEHFYIRPGFWTLPRPFDAALFDQAVNGGTTAAIRLLQRAINRAMKARAVTVDGVLGRRTRVSLGLAIARPAPVLQQLRLAARDRYVAIVLADPRQSRFLKGWRRRARQLGTINA